MKPGTKNSYKSLSNMSIDGKSYKYYSIKKAEELLHYRPSHNVKQGLKSAISWYWEYFSNNR